jgi:hypothetical protein
MPRKRCGRRSHRQHQKQPEWCSLPISQRQLCPSQQLSEVKRRKIRETNHNRRQRQFQAVSRGPQPPKTNIQQGIATFLGIPEQDRQNVCNEAVPAMNKLEMSRNEQHDTGQSVHAPTINSIPVDNTFRVISLIQQIVAEFSDAESEEARTMAVAKLVNMASRIHRPPKIIAFNGQRFELSKQLRDLHIYMAVLLETHLKPHERPFIPNYHLYGIDRHPE